DKCIAENYVFDEVLGVYIPRSTHERRVRFNSDDYRPTPDEVRRFPRRPVSPKQSDRKLDYIPTLVADRKKPIPKLKPPGYYND
ncbi:conjugal transfer protein, partial [Escherichia coli]|nr:conjugal transfer protein [Escherichia coli]